MSKLRFVFALLAAGSLVFFSACNNNDDDMPTFAAPTITGPSGVINVENGGSGTATFNVTVDPGLTASYTSTAAGVTISSGGSGDVSGGTIEVQFTAGTNAGAASITVTVRDSENQTDAATAVINIGEDPNTIIVSSNITEDATWTADKTWVLGGRIAVEDGATLTIEPGTVIKGEAGTGANATALLVARGGMLMAEGTAALPIIFTSVADEITPEQVAGGTYASPNLDPDANGFWGGVILCGKATISASNDAGDDVDEVQIEGIPATDTNGLYGGSEDGDNSGTLTYISIRHGGSNIGAGNEINGLTLGGVGSGTTISHVEVVANQDDGIEWFGGTVDVSNALVWNAGDDAIDTDQAWQGTLDNFIVVTPGDRSFELDGPEGSKDGKHTIGKGSIIASDEANEIISGDLINLDGNSQVDLANIFFTGIVLDPAQMINRIEAPDGELSFTNILLDVPADSLANHVNGDPIPAGIMAGNTKQADASAFDWTWAEEVGGIESLK